MIQKDCPLACGRCEDGTEGRVEDIVVRRRERREDMWPPSPKIVDLRHSWSGLLEVLARAPVSIIVQYAPWCGNSRRVAARHDKGDDVGLMEAWHALAGTRNVVYFGDNVAACLSSNSAEALGYLTNTMAVDQLSQCGGYSQNCGGVRDVIGGQTAPIVTPAPAYAGNFSTDFVTMVPSVTSDDLVRSTRSQSPSIY